MGEAFRLDPDRVAYFEAEGWRAYYDRRWLRLIRLTVRLNEEQFRIPAPTSWLAAYYVMRVGRLPLVPYFRPGDMALAEAVRGFAGKHHAVLLANHGPVVAGVSLDAAANAIEELEETAKLFLLLRGQRTRFLSDEQVAEVRAAFPS